VLKCPVLHFFCFDRISIHSDEAGDKWQVVEYFPCFSPTPAIGDISILAAIWTFGTILVFPSKATARVDTAVVSDGFETRRACNRDLQTLIVGTFSLGKANGILENASSVKCESTLKV